MWMLLVEFNEQSLGYRLGEPKIFLLAHNLPNRQGIPIDHPDVGSPEFHGQNRWDLLRWWVWKECGQDQVLW